jgi:hypothetical protein
MNSISIWFLADLLGVVLLLQLRNIVNELRVQDYLLQLNQTLETQASTLELRGQL